MWNFLRAGSGTAMVWSGRATRGCGLQLNIRSGCRRLAQPVNPSRASHFTSDAGARSRFQSGASIECVALAPPLQHPIGRLLDRERRVVELERILRGPQGRDGALHVARVTCLKLHAKVVEFSRKAL